MLLNFDGSSSSSGLFLIPWEFSSLKTIYLATLVPANPTLPNAMKLWHMFCGCMIFIRGTNYTLLDIPSEVPLLPCLPLKLRPQRTPALSSRSHASVLRLPKSATCPFVGHFKH